MGDYNNSLIELDYPVVEKNYTDAELKEVEQLCRQVFRGHKELFCGFGHNPFSWLFELNTVCHYFEGLYESCTSNPHEMVSLYIPNAISQGSCCYVENFAPYWFLHPGLMEITNVRYDRYVGGASLHWTAREGHLEHAVNFQVLMTIGMGTYRNGFSTLSELLDALRKWVAVADLVDTTDVVEIGIEKVRQHLALFGEVDVLEDATITIHPRTFPEVQYLLRPMYSSEMESRVLSKSTLSKLVLMSKPEYRPEKSHHNQECLRNLPCGSGDYVVAFDLNLTSALIFSPRLGLFYRVTVQLTGTTLDDCSNLASAWLVRLEPEKYIKGVTEIPQSGSKYFRSLKQFYDDPLAVTDDGREHHDYCSEK